MGCFRADFLFECMDCPIAEAGRDYKQEEGLVLSQESCQNCAKCPEVADADYADKFCSQRILNI